MRYRLQPVLIALALALPGAALAQNITADDPGKIAATLQEAGYKAELTQDDQGDPKIKSSAGGANYSIYFYGCANNKHCQSIQFSAGFDLTNGTTLEVVNDWNTKKRYGKVYLDADKDPYIEMDVNLAYGGVSRKGFLDTLDSWDRLLSDFQAHIDW